MASNSVLSMKVDMSWILYYNGPLPSPVAFSLSIINNYLSVSDVTPRDVVTWCDSGR